MKASVIISTYNGAVKLPVVLEALLGQTEKEFEVIIVVDGSTDNTLSVLSRYENIFFSLEILVQENSGRSIARNNGAKKSNSNLLIFYDDDMAPNPQSIEKHVIFHTTHNAILSGNQVEIESKWKTNIQNYKAALSKKWIEKYQEGINELNRANLFFTAANCSIKRNDFNIFGGFDERLTDAEDNDFAWRAMKSGVGVFFDYSNVAIHHDYITCTSYILRLRQYQHAQAQLKLLHPERYEPDIRSTPRLKRVIYRLFAFAFWPRLVDNTNLFSWIPKKMRHRLFDLIIHALSKEFPGVVLS